MMATKLRNPVMLFVENATGASVTIQLVEGTAMPVFSTSEQGEQSARAFSRRFSDPGRYSMVAIETLEQAKWIARQHSGIPLLVINPPADPDEPPKYHPFSKFLEIARSEAE
jgi:hypothetical protein